MWSRLFALVVVASASAAALADDTFTVPSSIATVFDQRCIDCHSGDSPEGDVRLDALLDMELDARLDLLNRAQEQLFLGRMPPDDAEQPSAEERTQLTNWVSQELRTYDASKFEKKLQKPEYGNYVDHEKLFSCEFKDLPGFTYDRRWLISEYIFNAKFQRMLLGNARARREGKTVSVVGSHRFNQFSLTNPFLLPNHSGVRYYADTDLTGGHLSSMLTNAQKTSQYITDYLAKRNSKYLPAITEIMALEDAHNATLAARREFLQKFIATLCEDYFGNEHQTMLPKFVPVELNPVKELAEGETYKKLPRPVAGNILSKLGGTETFYQLAGSPAYENKSDEEIQELCERIWFYNGDHERVIQGRLAILREYIADFRENIDDKTRSRYAAPALQTTGR